MDDKSITISRHELYGKIWTEPMIKLEERYGLSDFGLDKICKKHNISRPPRGHWAKKEAGKELKRTPLPWRDPDVLIEIRPNPYNISGSKVKISTMTEISSEKDPFK